MESYSSRSYDRWNPPQPVLERQPSHAAYQYEQPPWPTYREVLMNRQRAHAKQRAMAQVGPIRGHFRY